ncbi:MAG TPA: hypothetical protein VGQ96_05830, partial [Candidatus Eremiobacteraceae bacterium]|nr:hypothetical protein [Candidatus Eremiobacteraceae bacterium]
MVRRRRLAQLNRYNLGAAFDEISERLNRILSRERGTISERVQNAEEGAKGVVEKIAQSRLNQLEALSPEPGSALRELQDYEWMDSVAEQMYRDLMAELQQKISETFFENLNEGLRAMTPEATSRVTGMLHDLNQMLRERAEGKEPDFEAFMRKHGDMFADPKPRNLDELLKQMQEQIERMESMLQSLSPEQRRQLQSMIESAMSNEALMDELSELSAHLASGMPRGRLGTRFNFFGDESLPFGAAMDVIGDLSSLDAMERALRDTYRGQPLPPDKRDQIAELLGEDSARAVDQLSRLLQELEDQGYVERGKNGIELTPMGIRRIGQKALRDLFANLKRDRIGGHDINELGPGVEAADETKSWEFGDPFRMHVERTVLNAVKRGAAEGGKPRMKLEDFEVYKVDASSQAATVLMLDMSRSMPLRGNFYAAKKMAMALEQLIHAQFPRDDLYIIGFSDRAREIKRDHLPNLSSMECVYGTNMQAGFMRARQLLAKHTGANKQII